jgi:hydrogenase/urease accessory protein HupE
MRALFVLIWVATLAAMTPAPANAHALEPGYLEISQFGEGTWRVFWSRPDVKGKPMQIDAVLPASCTPTNGAAPSFNGSAWVTSWIASCPEGLVGGALTIQGLEKTATDVLVRYELSADSARTQRLVPSNTAFIIQGDPSFFGVIKSYVALGVDHILGGIDHLLFVFALLLLISNGWRLLGAITAFTVAHSITMAVATLGLVTLPPPPVEAVIALSIMFLASELVLRRGGQERLSERYPWAVSFSFGLLHGFGFAGALLEIGLPQGDVPLALLSFNVGVELGQLAFVAVVLAIGVVLARVAPTLKKRITAQDSKAMLATAYAIGSVSAFWVFDRLSGF